ncbi:DUF6049 family protein [Agromyces aurantiacus]|uniref:DUF6049 family protein n=1 Tax=Agromyces aurantiacus TaxID=165814 RepID=A0ABV9R2I1_9MICO|nr:DUF6049 family protein [Agromyces aurantiacus]MBM7502879.1 hypothetical protein [Agromyces aurantiacus]
MPDESTSHRRVRRLLGLAAGAASAALGLSWFIAPIAGSPGVLAAAAAESVEGVRLTIAPADGTAIAAGQPVRIQVEIVNGTDDAIRAGTLTLAVATDGLDDRAEVDAWLAPADGGSNLGTDEVAERATASLAAGAATTLEFTIPAEATSAEDPVVGLAAGLDVDGDAVSTATTIVANTRVPVETPAGLVLAFPLTVPPLATGLIPADRLESWTAPNGLLTRQLDAVSGAPVAVGIDPRVIASIRVLGDAAPESAVEWLARLAAMPNEVFPLAYADADLAAQAQVGLDAPLEPLGFEDVIDPADFPADAGEEPVATDGGATPAPGGTPDTAAVLDWDYTRTDIAWPADETVATGDLDWFAEGGLTTAILSPGNVEGGGDDTNAGARIEGRTAVVADARVTDALRDAAAASSDTAWRGATARLTAELALAGHDDAVTLLGTFARSAGLEADRVEETVAALAPGQWARPATLADAVGAPPTSRTLASTPEDRQRIENIDRMLQAERSVQEFSDVLADPAPLTFPTRRDLLALLDVGWFDQPEEWTSSVGTWLVDRRAVTDSVSIVPTSSVLVVASETGIPITIENDLPYPVDVVVEVAPSNGRLIVEETVEATVEAESRSTVQVPVAAGVGSGEVNLEVSLTSPDGTPVGTSVRIPANVQADWEGLGATVLAAIAVAVFAIGLIRAFRRRRRDRTAETTDTDAADTSSRADGPDATSRPAEPESTGRDALDEQGSPVAATSPDDVVTSDGPTGDAVPAPEPRGPIE